MPEQFHSPEDKDYTQAQAQMDLLEALLELDDAPYPWNPADPESEAYFAEREQDFLPQDWSEEEIATSQSFFNQLEQLWSANTATTNNSSVAASHPSQALPLQFAACIPEGWVEKIAHRADRVFSTHSSIADQLVQCVQDLLPHWAKDELLLLARPFAYTTRGKEAEAIAGVLGNVCTRDWTTLSEVEQARASLAIARYVVIQLQHSQ